jgi:hypothetical protein
MFVWAKLKALAYKTRQTVYQLKKAIIFCFFGATT